MKRFFLSLFVLVFCLPGYFFFGRQPSPPLRLTDYRQNRVEPPSPRSSRLRPGSVQILVDSGPIWQRIRDDIQNAKARVYVQTMSFEGDPAGRLLADALLASKAPDKRVLADAYSLHYISDKLLVTHPSDQALIREKAATLRMADELRQNGVELIWTNPMRPSLFNLPARNHKKMIVIDDQVSYIGGLNFCDHNFSWHDMMIRFHNSDVARFLKQDFLATWSGRNQVGQAEIDFLRFYLFDGQSNEAVYADIISLLESAQKEIWIESAYLTFPFFDSLRLATKRGVRVVLITPEKNNKKFLQQYLLWDARRSGCEVWLYQGGMSHLKAVLIDDRRLIVGSPNFDFMGYSFQQELAAVISDSTVIADFKARVMKPDYENSLKYEGTPSAIAGNLRYGALRLLDQALKIAN